MLHHTCFLSDPSSLIFSMCSKSSCLFFILALQASCSSQMIKKSIDGLANFQLINSFHGARPIRDQFAHFPIHRHKAWVFVLAYMKLILIFILTHRHILSLCLSTRWKGYLSDIYILSLSVFLFSCFAYYLMPALCGQKAFTKADLWAEEKQAVSQKKIVPFKNGTMKVWCPNKIAPWQKNSTVREKFHAKRRDPLKKRL